MILSRKQYDKDQQGSAGSSETPVAEHSQARAQSDGTAHGREAANLPSVSALQVASLFPAGEMSMWLRKEPVHQLMFKQTFIRPILEGRKTQTIRRSTHCAAGDLVAARCQYHRPPFALLRISAIESFRFDELSESDACADGFQSVSELRMALRKLYPRLLPTVRLYRIRFDVESVPEQQPTR